jgi:predicted dehydrogenase
MRAVIVGCGFIGQKRAKHLGAVTLAGACDMDPAKANALAAQHPGCVALGRWRDALALPDVQIAIISATHDQLAPMAEAALRAGLHVLVEKPAARSRAELEPVARAAKETGRVVKVGFNHRYHPAFRKAHEILAKGKAGPLMFIRARYGHGGRPGYDREWRADPVMGGGGELIDQGMHLIDLSRSFLGDFSDVSGYVPTFFWDMPVEDNAFLLLKTPRGQAAWLHATWTEWKNLFSFEIYAKFAKLQIDGLGGSYGTERLTHYQMQPEMGPPPAEVFEFAGADESWGLEFADFLRCIETGAKPQGGLEDALAALAIVDQIYAAKAAPKERA